MTEYDNDLRPAYDGNGLTIAFDPDMTQLFREIASRENSKQRRWFEPDGRTIAYHLSDINNCLRKARFKRDQLQQQVDEEGHIQHPVYTGSEITRYSRGHALQQFFIGSEFPEESIWSDRYQLLYSPDGGATTPIEFKTSLSAPLVKADRESGLSIEDVLMTGGTRSTYYAKAVKDWKRYMLQTMHLHGWTQYYLSVVYLNQPGDWLTFKYTATPERIQNDWDEWSEHRVKVLHAEEIPSVLYNTDPDQCETCPFFENCRDELYGMSGGLDFDH